MSEMKFLQVYW